ncbi:hypothetical protein B0H13DRAFT_1933771 [Mycena leptocephala]|nr:hypothetical protein B0H13DRAFT_1933771 [Mycena leptocephala]
MYERQGVIRRGCALTRRIWAEKAMRMATEASRIADYGARRTSKQPGWGGKEDRMSMEQRESREAQEDGRRVDPEIRNVRLMGAGSGAEELVCVGLNEGEGEIRKGKDVGQGKTRDAHSVERKWKTGLEEARERQEVRMADVGDGWAMEGIRGPQGATVYLTETEESMGERQGDRKGGAQARGRPARIRCIGGIGAPVALDARVECGGQIIRPGTD